MTKSQPAGITGNLRNITIVKLNLKTLFQGKYSLTDKQELHTLVENGIKSGNVQPLPTTVYPAEQNLKEAFE